MRQTFFSLSVCLIASAALSDGGDFSSADVIYLGELHDNPAHHARQAELVAELSPKAVVYEMLSPAQAAQVTPDLLGDAVALEATLGWNESGWPDFNMYYPIFAASGTAQVYGAALPRAEARKIMEHSIAEVFGPDATLFGLSEDLPSQQQEAREALQLQAHCDMMPAEMLPVMVNIQRLRDARLAQAALAAMRDHGRPVIVITGNGHARTDWGAPAAMLRAAPEVQTLSLGQGEDTTGPPEGSFDVVEITAGVDRGDPCEAFR